MHFLSMYQHTLQVLKAEDAPTLAKQRLNVITNPAKHNTILPLCHNSKCNPQVILSILIRFYHHHSFTGHKSTRKTQPAESELKETRKTTQPWK